MATDELSDLYRELILEHSRHPRNLEKIDDPSLASEGTNPFCGDEVCIQIDLDSSDAVKRIGVQTIGCAINKASASILSELVEGSTLHEAATISQELRSSISSDRFSPNPLINALSGVKKIPIRVKCALLPWSILDEIVENHLNPNCPFNNNNDLWEHTY